MVKRICKVDGCDGKHLAKGYCQLHYHRLRNTGKLEHRDRVFPPNRLTRECEVEGCCSPQWTKGLCHMHARRVRVNGDPGQAESMVAAKGDGCTRKDGYRVVYSHGHPLADKNGQVLEHRIVLYSKIGPGPHTCYWCGKRLLWVQGVSDALFADHLDWVRGNNVPGNLVPSCCGCNARRIEGEVWQSFAVTTHS